MKFRTLEILLARGGMGEKLAELVQQVDRLQAERDMLRAELDRQAVDLEACERAEYGLEDQAQLLDLIREAIVVHDRQADRIVFWNPGAEELYGWSAAEAVGRRADELLHTRYPCDRQAIEDTLVRTGAWEGEVVHTRRNGEEIVVATRWTLKYDDDGQAQAVVETNVDVTARRRESEIQGWLAAIVHNVQEAIISVDARSVVTSWNPSAERMLGFSADEMIGKQVAFIIPEGREADWEHHRAAQRGEPVAPYETVRRRKDGTLVPVVVTLSPLKDTDGVVQGIAALLRDLSEVKRLGAEVESHARALGRQQAFISRLIHEVPAGIAYLDQDLVIRWANPEYSRIVGQLTEEFLDRSIYDAFPSSPRPSPRLQAVLETRRSVRAVVPYRKPGSDETTYWDLSYVPILDERGDVEGILVLVLDVTDRLENERLQQERIVTLEETERMKDEFLSVLSHELRTPINAIMGFGSILDDELVGPLTPEQHQYMEKILGSSDRLLRLVDDLLVLSRAIAGKLLLEIRPMALHTVALAALESLRPNAAEKQMHLIDTMPAELPPVLADPPRIRQILHHLIENAVKFTPAGGSIRLSARAEGDWVRVTVSDTGPGIPEAAIPLLFRRFTQLDMSATRTVGGTGLGLALVKALVDAHGGELGVETAPGQGAAFWFTLPVAPPSEPGA